LVDGKVLLLAVDVSPKVGKVPPFELNKLLVPTKLEVAVKSSRQHKKDTSKTHNHTFN